jgi:hypothetical protein
MVRFPLLITILICGQVWARDGERGVKMEVSIGMPSLSITNPDGSKANYGGLAGAAKGLLPLIGSGSFRTNFTAGFRYLDFENKANGDQSEYAQYLGPGLGLELSLSRFVLGADYFFLKGRHTTVGTFSHKTEFDITGLNYYAGIQHKFGSASIGLIWSQMNATISGGDVGISGDSKWANQTYWLQFTYHFKSDTGKFLKGLFKD